VLDHLALQAADVDAAAASYTGVLAPAGVHAPSRQAVDDVHEAAVAAAVEAVHHGPGPAPAGR
jgi:catechol 2,3-dioxygenase-like lactoylglutathione lyase family enzyme